MICDNCHRKFLGVAHYSFTKRRPSAALRWTCLCHGCKTGNYDGQVYLISKWDVSWGEPLTAVGGTIVLVAPGLPPGAKWQIDEVATQDIDAKIEALWAHVSEVSGWPA